jgi:hypothetical protein
MYSTSAAAWDTTARPFSSIERATDRGFVCFRPHGWPEHQQIRISRVKSLLRALKLLPVVSRNR